MSLVLVLLLACDGPVDATEFLDTGEIVDQDGDGVPASEDCNDLSPTTYPGATETCDSRDEDCDDLIDEDAGPLWYADTDGDGYGDPDVEVQACTVPSGHVSNAEDCDDDDSEVNPGATEICNDTDDDCNGEIDEAGFESTFYRDADEDGYGDPEDSVEGCTAPEGYVDNAEDCDDADAGYNPGVPGDCSATDYDCSGRLEADELPGGSSDCPGTTCKGILSLAGQTLSDGLYWIDPASIGKPYEAWCDMTTDGGGYTFLKLDPGSLLYAIDAERECQQYSLQLFIPRTEDHLLSAWALATDTAAGGDATDDYLYIMGIYPAYNGARCERTPLKSDNPACNWVAGDGGDFWVTDLSTFTEPNGDNDTSSSMYYDFDSYGAVSAFNDINAPGYGSERFMCSMGDK